MSSPLNIRQNLDTGTEKQRRIDAACTYQAVVDEKKADDLKRMLEPDDLMRMDCRVIKHPDCCAPCRANNDCERLPMHVQCRCRRDDYLTLTETNY